MAIIQFKESRKAQSKITEQSRTPKAVRLGLQIVFIITSFFLLYNVAKSIYQTNFKLQILQQAEKEVEGLRLENIDLVMESDRVIEDEYIEAEARNRLNYGLDGEIQLVIPDELVNAELEEDLVHADSRSVLQEWLDFLVIGL
ncbi:hypothetical protein GF357_00670 [Candidatus Dojkabacteria bacterium]|nr:hypothetical protein [Candidatus Dojkabacteria bacterium]